MTDQDNEEKQNMRIMWIASGVIAPPISLSFAKRISPRR